MCFLPDVSDDTGIGLITRSAAPIRVHGLAFSTGTYVEGPPSNATDCFREPTSSDAVAFFDFVQGSGITAVDRIGSADFVLGGTQPADGMWQGSNIRSIWNTDPNTSAQTVYYVSGSTVSGGRGELHSPTNNRTANDNPIIGMDDGVNVYSDKFSFMLSTLTTDPDHWDPAASQFGGLFAAIRNDLSGALPQSGQLTDLAQIELGNNNGASLHGQTEVNDGGIDSSWPNTATDPLTDGDYLCEIEGDGAGTIVSKARRLGRNGGTVDNDWIILSTITGAQESVWNNQGFRIQSKWQGAQISGHTNGATATDDWNNLSGFSTPSNFTQPQVAIASLVEMSVRGACGGATYHSPDITAMTMTANDATVVQSSANTVYAFAPLVSFNAAAIEPPTSTLTMQPVITEALMEAFDATGVVSTGSTVEFGWFTIEESPNDWTEIVDG